MKKTFCNLHLPRKIYFKIVDFLELIDFIRLIQTNKYLYNSLHDFDTFFSRECFKKCFPDNIESFSEFGDNLDLQNEINKKNNNIFLSSSTGNLWKNKLICLSNLKENWFNSLKYFIKPDVLKQFINLIFEAFRGFLFLISLFFYRLFMVIILYDKKSININNIKNKFILIKIY